MSKLSQSEAAYRELSDRFVKLADEYDRLDVAYNRMEAEFSGTMSALEDLVLSFELKGDTLENDSGCAAYRSAARALRKILEES